MNFLYRFMDWFIGWIYPNVPLPMPSNDSTHTPVSAPKPPPDKSSNLVRFCTSIRDYEGRPGSLNYQLNNPGDCRPSPVGYLPKYGLVEIIDTNTDPRYLYHKGKFAKFPTYALGWEYLLNMVHFTAANHPAWTLYDFFAHYAPTKDGNSPKPYAENVAKRCGISPSDTLASYLI